ncbi:MAG: InlB B-repeat-containing protein, partial [Clostridia bacterium]|nr:InlB B-repeat-containing protein [Clostridia bacterium]
MNKLSRLTALLLALMILLGSVSLAEGGLPIGGSSGLTSDDWADLVDTAEDKLFFTDEGDTGKEITPEAPEQPEKPAFYPYTDIEELTLIQSETAAEASITASGAAILTHEAAGQWQIAIGGVWANLYGETSSTLTVTSAMMNGRISAEIRKALGDKNAETGEYVAYTQTAVINLIEAVPAMFSVSRDATDMVASDANDGIMTLEMANQENMVIVQVIYRIKDTDQPVADAYIGQIAKGSALNTSLTLPRVTGYLARACTVVPAILVDKNITTFTEQTADTAGSLTINVTQEVSQQDITIYVDYEPAEVTFTVKHMRQKVENDEYELYAEELLTGKTGEQVGDKLAKTYEGFSAIWYDPTTAIAADGSTVVEIHYNREYYLLTFDLGGGYGVEPIFAKFGTTVGDVGEPTRAGYDFAGWVDAAGNEATIPENMPAYDVELTAKWTQGKASFIVAYWLDDPNELNDKEEPVYNYWGSYEVTQYADNTEVKSGDIVQGITYKDYPAEVADKLDKHERRYSKYHHADENVPVKGDGSTVVNVYYHRNEYTLKFYYAMDDGSDPENAKNYVVGGSTYYFGTYANINHSALQALQASYTAGNNIGEVDEPPRLNEKGKSRGYKTGTEQYQKDGYSFHYIAFTAKYGANISELWPCGVFEPVTRVSKNTHGNWAKMEAYVSAWNGEYKVYYSHHNENQTIKGNYNRLDYNLLWDNREDCKNTNHNFGESDTVSYLCFWDNGANVNWSIPELYRYQIWVPVLSGQDVSNLPANEIKTINDVTYYKQNTYDTFDDSAPFDQTPPSIVGMTCINSPNDTEWSGESDYRELRSQNKGNLWTGNSAEPDENWEQITIPEDTRVVDGKVEYLYYETNEDGTKGDAAIKEAYIVNFYYTRNDYNLTFNNYGVPVTSKAAIVPFGQDISGKYFVPEYPANQEPGALQFVGWYTTPTFIAGTEFKFDTMPAHDVALYARWELVKHNVQFWIDEKSVGSDAAGEVAYYENISHGMSVGDAYSGKENYVDPEEYLNQHQEYKDYTFAGWYFIDEDGTENRFDIKNTPVKADMDIYAKWTSDTPVKFVFRYVHVDANGNETIELAPPTEGLALPNSPVTMSAKIGTDLTQVPDGNDPLSYIPEVSSHTLDIQVDETKNVFVFKYHMPEKVKYTVQYLAAEYKDVDGKQVLVISLDDEGEPIHLIDEKTVETDKAVVTENYVPVPNRMPQATQLRLIVSMKAEMNVIQFLYVENKEEAPYNVSHYIVDYTGKASLHTSETNKTDKIDADVAVNKLKDEDIPGYTFAYAKVAVPTQNGDTWEDVLHDPESETDTQVLHKLSAAGMHVYLYYEPIKYPVIIQYLDAITEKPLKDADGEEIPFKTVYLPYEFIVQTADYYKEIPDYRYVRMDPLEHKVRIEPDPDNPTVNVLKIFYTLDVANIKISKTITESPDNDAQKLTDEQWKTAFPFTVKLTAKAGKSVQTVDVTLPGKERGTMTTVNGVLTFELKNNESAIIHDLWVGTKYEIEEAEQEDFKTTYSVATSGILDSMGVDMTVINTYPKYVGELTIKKDGLTGGESAIVKAEVGSDIYYLVLNATNGYTATISGIKPGTSYNVSEVTNWTWQYSSTISGGSGTITEENATAR